MTTPFLGLNTYDTASGSLTTFLDFRLGLAGNSSNMTVIDNYLNDVSGSVSGLVANRLIAVEASQILPNYFESSVPIISSYVTNMAINLKLNNSISGSTTLNINGLGVKTLKKTNSSGSYVQLSTGDIYANQYLPFVYNGTDFILLGSNSVSTSGCSYTGSSPINVSGSVISLSTVAISGSTTFNQFTVDTWGRISSASYVASGSSSGVYTGSNVITVTGSVISHNTSTVVSGSYNAVYVDSRGHVTSGCVLAFYTGSGPISISGSIISHSVSTVVSGSYNAVYVDGRGHVTSGCNISYSGTTSASNFTVWEPMAKPGTSGSYNDEFDNESVSGTWTIFNPNSLVSFSEDTRGLIITSDTATPEVCGIYKQVNHSGYCTVWTRVFNTDEESTEHVGGLWISGSFSSGSETSPIYTIGLYNSTSGSQEIIVNHWSDYQNISSTIKQYNVYRNTGIYLRARIQNSYDLYVDISENGVGWKTILAAHTMPFDPTDFGLTCSPGNYTYTGEESIFSFFRFIDGASEPNQIMSGSRIKGFYK